MTARARTPALALSTISASTSRIELMRIIWALAWPAIMTFGLESLVGLIDTLMVGRLGANAVAGVGVGSQILNAVSVMNMALATGTVALVARHVGAAQRHEAGAVVTQSIYLALAMGLAIAVPMSIYAPHLVAIFKVEPEVLENGAGFVRMVRSPDTFPFPDIPIIMLTGHGERSRVIEAIQIGVNEFLLKPVSSKALQGRLIAVLTKPREIVKAGGYYGPVPRNLVASMHEDGDDAQATLVMVN